MDQQRKILDNLKLTKFTGERKLTEFSEESVKILSQNNFNITKVSSNFCE